MSQTTEDLRKVGNDLKTSGFPVSSAVCLRCADRMESMEELIVSLQHAIPEDPGRNLE